MSFIIRQATEQDCDVICKLHIASIQHYCSDFYPEGSVVAWTGSKTPETYKNIPDQRVCIVVEVDKNIIGFGLLNLAKKSIDSLYLAPDFSGKGYGKALLFKLEQIALEYGINELTLSATLNAVKFYHAMGYVGEEKSICRLSAEVQLDCVVMVKKLIFDNKMIEKIIRDLEQQLLDPEFHNTQDVALLLADEFIEFGSSGYVYNKQQVIESLLIESKIKRVMTDFKVIELASGVILATYKISSENKISLRSSIWKLIDDRWQMVFHQGTCITK